MNLKDIKQIAQKQGVKTGKMKKEEIIHAIQRAEGNSDCFGKVFPCTVCSLIVYGEQTA